MIYRIYSTQSCEYGLKYQGDFNSFKDAINHIDTKRCQNLYNQTIYILKITKKGLWINDLDNPFDKNPIDLFEPITEDEWTKKKKEYDWGV